MPFHGGSDNYSDFLLWGDQRLVVVPAHFLDFRSRLSDEEIVVFRVN